MRRALLVGVDKHERFGALSGCVDDVRAVNDLLSRHDDGAPNSPTTTGVFPIL